MHAQVWSKLFSLRGEATCAIARFNYSHRLLMINYRSELSGNVIFQKPRGSPVGFELREIFITNFFHLILLEWCAEKKITTVYRMQGIIKFASERTFQKQCHFVFCKILFSTFIIHGDENSWAELLATLHSKNFKLYFLTKIQRDYIILWVNVSRSICVLYPVGQSLCPAQISTNLILFVQVTKIQTIGNYCLFDIALL